MKETTIPIEGSDEIRWVGKKAKLRLQLYDKRKERTGRHQGDVIRAEIQIIAPKIFEWLHSGTANASDPVPTLCFNRCYRRLRETLWSFTSWKELLLS